MGMYLSVRNRFHPGERGMGTSEGAFRNALFRTALLDLMTTFPLGASASLVSYYRESLGPGRWGYHGAKVGQGIRGIGRVGAEDGGGGKIEGKKITGGGL